MAPTEHAVANCCKDGCVLLEEHGQFKEKLENGEKRMNAMSGRPTWAVLSIISFLGIIASIFATMHFSESGLLYEMSGKQQAMSAQLAEVKDELRQVHEQSTKNAGALEALSLRIWNKP